jgi:hypothetical protein
MLDVIKYKQTAIDESLRCELRGFTNFVSDVLAAAQQQQPIKGLCEIGVSQGSKHRMWCEVTTDDCDIVGVDVYDPDRAEHYALRHEIIHIDNLIRAREVLEDYPKLSYVLGEDGYLAETVDRALSAISSDKFDIVLDDGATCWPDMRNSLPSWSRAITATGCYITETPTGNGDTQKEVDLEQNKIWFEELVVHGMVIFDLSEFNQDGDEHDNYGNFVGIWAPNIDLYVTVVKKYEEYIVAGKQHIDHMLQ